MKIRKFVSVLVALSAICAGVTSYGSEGANPCVELLDDTTGSMALNENVCIVDKYFERNLFGYDEVTVSDEGTLYRIDDKFVLAADMGYLLSVSDTGEDFVVPEVAAVGVAIGMGVARCAANAGCRTAVRRGAAWLASGFASSALYDAFKKAIM